VVALQFTTENLKDLTIANLKRITAKTKEKKEGYEINLAAILDKFGEIGKAALQNDGYADDDEAKGVLHGATSVVSTRGYRTSSLTLPILRPSWKGYHIASILPESSGIALGLTFFFVTIVSIVVVSHSFLLVIFN
jgi:hypothetical protein